VGVFVLRRKLNELVDSPIKLQRMNRVKTTSPTDEGDFILYTTDSDY
jgi:hypothetical protein